MCNDKYKWLMLVTLHANITKRLTFNHDIEHMGIWKC